MSGAVRRMIALALVLTLTAALGGGALAMGYGYTVDVAAMRALEDGCAFPVQVIEKKAVEEVFDTNDSRGNPDALVVTVVNNTDATVTEVRVCLIVYDDNAAVVKPWTDAPRINEQAEITVLGRSDLALAPGQSCAVSMQVNYADTDGVPRFTGARALVASYVDGDGNTFENPDYAEWQSLAFGMSGSNGTELD